jgi:hypothetical protein
MTSLKLFYRRGAPAALLLGLIVGAPDIAQALDLIPSITGSLTGRESPPNPAAAVQPRAASEQAPAAREQAPAADPGQRSAHAVQGDLEGTQRQRRAGAPGREALKRD